MKHLHAIMYITHLYFHTHTANTAQHSNTETVHRIKGFHLHYVVDSFPDPDEEQRVDLPRDHVTTPRPATPTSQPGGGAAKNPVHPSQSDVLIWLFISSGTILAAENVNCLVLVWPPLTAAAPRPTHGSSEWMGDLQMRL